MAGVCVATRLVEVIIIIGHVAVNRLSVRPSPRAPNRLSGCDYSISIPLSYKLEDTAADAAAAAAANTHRIIYRTP